MSYSSKYSSNSLKVKKHLNSQQAGNTRNSEIGFSDFNIYYQSSRKKIGRQTQNGTTHFYVYNILLFHHLTME